MTKKNNDKKAKIIKLEFELNQYNEVDEEKNIIKEEIDRNKKYLIEDILEDGKFLIDEIEKKENKSFWTKLIDFIFK